jgi:hypothetical protein
MTKQFGGATEMAPLRNVFHSKKMGTELSSHFHQKARDESSPSGGCRGRREHVRARKAIKSFWITLARRSARECRRKKPPFSHFAEYGCYVKPRITGDRPVFGLLGKLRAALYKAPMLRLLVETAGKPPSRFRFLPAPARGGFLLSPLIDSNESFIRLMSGLPAAVVQSVRVVTAEPGAALFYQSEIYFEFSRIEFEGQDDLARAQEGLESLVGDDV